MLNDLIILAIAAAVLLGLRWLVSHVEIEEDDLPEW